MADVIVPTPAGTTEPAVPGDRVRWSRRQRRPSGAPPPLPRKLGVTGAVWVVLIVLSCAGAIVVHSVQPAMRLLERVDTWWLRILADLRGPWLTHVMRGIDDAGTGWALTVLALGLACAIMVFRRWGHLLVLLGSMGLLLNVGGLMLGALARPRPYDVRIIGDWSGFSMPSPPVGIFGALLVGILYTMLPPGRWRN